MKLQETVVDTEDTALGRLSLRRYAADDGQVGHAVYIDEHFLMATHGARGERFMAELAARRIVSDRSALRVLIGGLGAGHTLRATLDMAGVANVEVSEIGAKVVEWNRQYFARVNGNALDDPRVVVHHEPLQDTVARNRAHYDLLLVDVDNGPGWLASPHNQQLYQVEGLGRCRAALRKGGVLAIWSPDPNDELRRRLVEVFTQVEVCHTDTLDDADDAINDVVYLAYD